MRIRRFSARVGTIGLTVLVGMASVAYGGGPLSLNWYTLDGGGGRSSGGALALHGTIGQADPGPLTGGIYRVDGGYWIPAAATAACTLAAHCADVDANTVRDDNCTWWACAAGACQSTPIAFADMGGAFGACAPDGFTNIHDRNHALTCFSGTNTCAAINIDAGGAFGSCIADGFCNIHDANHALAAFAGTTSCTCPSGPMPELPPDIRGTAELRLEVDAHTLAPGDAVALRVFADDLTAPLRSYQIGLVASGGAAGRLELTDVLIEPRRDAAFAERDGVFSAINVVAARMLAGLDADDGVAPRAAAYLATFVYRATDDAVGPFVVDIDTTAGSYLVAPGDGQIELRTAAPVTLDIAQPGHRRPGKGR